MERFHRDEPAYAKWLDMNPHGFVVTEAYSRLHAARCSYVKTYDRSRSTSTPKLCFRTRRDLEAWVSNERARLLGCSECKIDTPDV